MPVGKSNNVQNLEVKYEGTFSPISQTTGRSWIMNLRPSPSDVNAVARSMVVDPIPPPTSTTVLP